MTYIYDAVLGTNFNVKRSMTDYYMICLSNRQSLETMNSVALFRFQK